MARGRPAQGSGRPQLSRADIVEAGVRLTERTSLAALTVQAVAAELGVTPPAIYHWVPNRAALIAEVGDHVLREIESSDPGAGSWEERLRRVLFQTRDLLRRYPGVAELWLGRWPPPTAGLRRVDDVLRLLMEGGFDPAAAARAFTVLYSYTMGHLMAAPPETALRAPRPDAAGPLPALAAVQQHAVAQDADSEFAFGLEVLLHGLRAGLAAPGG